MQRAGLGRFAEQNGFSTMERISEKNSDLRSPLNREGGQAGVKGPDERQTTAPLTPASPPKRFPTPFSQKTGKKEY
jgi:hypothetical protein